MSIRTITLSAAAVWLVLAFPAGAQDSGEMPPADQPAEALPPPAEPPPPLPPPSAVAPETLQRLARDADGVWRVAILATGRPGDRAALRFADRVALTQADLHRRLERLARAQGIELPNEGTAETRQRVETLRAQPPEASAGVLAALVRQSYPAMLKELEGWSAEPEQAVAQALLPPLRAELEQAERMDAPALTGSSGGVQGSASPQ